MPYIIDAHEDIAYSALTFNRDYLRSVRETREREAGNDIPTATGDVTLGFPEYQRGKVALVIGTIYLTPKKYQSANWPGFTYATPAEAFPLTMQQFDYYERLVTENPHAFQTVRSRADLARVVAPYLKSDAVTTERPVGIVLSMEGAEGIRSMDDLEEFWERGLRLIGPVWAGTRFCGGSMEHQDFTAEGFLLLEAMASHGYVLDIAHMDERSCLTAIDRYEGTVIASHANVRKLLPDLPGERHLTDATIRALFERDGIMGVIPFNKFLRPGWTAGEDRRLTSIDLLVTHIDTLCQMAGDSHHVGIGSDFDGGFGLQDIPVEMDSIADLQMLDDLLRQKGYSPVDVQNILGGNWLRMLDRNLPGT